MPPGDSPIGESLSKEPGQHRGHEHDRLRRHDLCCGERVSPSNRIGVFKFAAVTVPIAIMLGSSRPLRRAIRNRPNRRSC